MFEWLDYNIVIDKVCIRYFKKNTNIPHRLNGPAIIYHDDGFRLWYRDNQLHNDNGPAITYINKNNTFEAYYLNNQLQSVKRFKND